MRWKTRQPPEFFQTLHNPELAVGNRLHQAVNLPKAAQIVLRRLDALNVNKLVQVVILPECTSEGGGREHETAVDAKHPGDIGQMPLDPLAARPALVQCPPQLHHKAGSHPEIGSIVAHAPESLTSPSRPTSDLTLKNSHCPPADPGSTSAAPGLSVQPHMNRSSIIALVLAAAVTSLSAAPRIALVRVTDIYAKLPSTQAMQKRVKKQHHEILKDPRAVDLRRILSELEDMQNLATNKKDPLDGDAETQLFRSYQIKSQESLTLQREFEEFRKDKAAEINRAMVAEMRASLNRISDTARKLAKERGFDLLLDSSGNTNTGVPFVLFSKDTPDLTEDTMAALQDYESAAAAARAAAEDAEQAAAGLVPAQPASANPDGKPAASPATPSPSPNR
jgi:Skp family chaperone for outer membrane proteins